MNKTSKKVMMTLAAMTAISSSAMAAGLDNTVDSTAAHYGAEAYGYTNTITATGRSAFAVGYKNTVSAENALAYGIKNKAEGINSLVGGEYSKATGRNSVAIGSHAEALQDNTFAIGSQARTSGENTVAIGNGAYANGVSSIVLGRTNTVNGDDTTVVGANNGTISAGQSAVFGYNNQVLDSSKEQLAFGSNNKTKSQGATVLGSHGQAVAVDSLALGNNTLADVQNSVALGTNSTTEEAVSTNYIHINGKRYDFAGGVANSTISIGTNNKAGNGGVKEYKRTLTNVAAGRVDGTSTDAINGSQLNAVINALKFTTVAEGTNTTVKQTTNIDGSKEFSVHVNKDLVNMNSVNFGTNADTVHSVVNKEKAHFFNGDTNTAVTYNGLKLENTNNLDTASYTMNGMQASSNGKDIRFSTDGISAGNQIISNVKAGIANTDAVNVSQLKGVQNNVVNNTSRINDLGQKVNTNANDIRAVEHTILDHEGRITVLENGVKDLDNKINTTAGNVLNQSKSYTDNQAAKVGANAAALSALHPLDFNADEKWQFSVGFGNYKGKNATALGAFYQPNENVLLSVGTTLGTGENMVNTGATVRFGSHSSMTTNKQVAVAKEVQDLKLQLSAISQKYDNLVKNLSAQKTGQDVDFEYSDLPKDHWAYDFVKKLSDKGYLNGYPDGTFKGDAKMTRYEFAVALWRAVNNGAIIDAQMAKAIKEFEPELEEVNKIMRYRIDTVAGKDNSVHKTERLRVNKNDDLFTHMKRDDYGTETYINK